MRRVVYCVAMSLDGYIADPDDGYGWIPEDPAIDFERLVARFDTFVMGRRTYEVTRRSDAPPLPGRVIVASTTLDPDAHPDVTVAPDAIDTVSALRAGRGKDIWLFGGGVLFRGLLGAGLVDGVEIAVVPVLLGDGRPVLPTPGARTRLELEESTAYPSGIVILRYRVGT